MKILILAWLPLLTATLPLTGVLALGVGSWRARHKPPVGWVPWSVLVSAGLCLLLMAGAGYLQYLSSHRGRLDQCKSTLVKAIATAIDMYAADHQGRLPAQLRDLTPTYLKALPKCPAVGRDTYSESYRRLTTSEGTGYRVSCGGRNHGGAGVTSVDLPTFHSNTGTYCDDHAERTRH